MSVSRRSVDRIFARFADVDSRLWAGIFFGILGLYTLAVVVESLSYSSAAQLFPLVIGVPFLGLIALKLVLLVLRDRALFESMSVFDFDEELEQISETEIAPAVRYRREFVMILWLVGLSALLWAFGFYPALVVFLFTFVTIYEHNLVRGALVTLGTFGFVYLFFTVLLGAILYEGAYTIVLPGLRI